MAISEDTANQPASVHSTNMTATTASFSPQANTLMVALVSADGAGGASATTAAVTDSLSGTWTLLKRQNNTGGGVGGSAEVWCRYVSSAPGSVTVTATWNTNGAAGGALTVRCLLGANSTQPGAVGGTGGTPVAPTATLTPTVIGSWVYGANLNFSASTSMTANANTTRIDQFQDTTNGDNWNSFKGATAVASLSSTTYGYTNSNTSYNTAAAEILAAAGGGAVVQPPPVVVGQAVSRAATW